MRDNLLTLTYTAKHPIKGRLVFFITDVCFYTAIIVGFILSLPITLPILFFLWITKDFRSDLQEFHIGGLSQSPLLLSLGQGVLTTIITSEASVRLCTDRVCCRENVPLVPRKNPLVEQSRGTHFHQQLCGLACGQSLNVPMFHQKQAML